MKNKKLLIANIAGIFLLLCTVMIFSNTAQAASKAQIKKWLTSKTWSNKVEDPIMEFSTKYTFRFKKDGTVRLMGHRNKDFGTYKVIGKNKNRITFNKLYYDLEGQGWRKYNGKYTATIKITGKNRFKAKFKNVEYSSVQNGYFY